ncbi:MAG: non-ribosomal peptide synthase/polyketide synthase, partial [Pseudomonadota bacterium]|nr:non-ribosomal peptide synthase/polyketide synthase [Pseudomonadota bacterium]
LLKCSAELWNMYGPTETTIWSACSKIIDAQKPINVGQPIDNTSCYVVDDNLNPVPQGITGELLIGGLGVARGYLNQPELNDEKFIPNPFIIDSDQSQKLYRTGDLARLQNDGSIQILGRSDFQVKLRGFRIELGEIETELSKLKEVEQCVVLLREDALIDQRLVGYLTTTKNNEIPDTEALNEHLRGKLPGYMIPSVFVQLDKFPLTPNGKINRKELPEPEWKPQEQFVAPKSNLEKSLAAIWAEVLKVEKVGIYDDFFAMGGHSLLATQLISKILDKLKIELPLMVLFNERNIVGLAKEIGYRETSKHSTIKKLPRNEIIPLSFAQQRLWFLDELSPGNPMYNVPWVMKLEGSININALQSALDKLISRHESLRTIFPNIDGEPIQKILPNMPVKILTEDMRGKENKIIQDRLTSLAQQQMNLSKGPLVYISLLRVKDNSWLFSQIIHHIVFDAGAHIIFIDELSKFYNSELRNESIDLPPLPLEFADYANWQREWFDSEDFHQQLDYWKNKLADAPNKLDLPTDHQRPKIQTSNGANIARMLPDNIYRGILDISKHQGASLFMVTLAVFNLLMSRLSGQNDLLVGTPISGRNRSELEKIIGFFLHTLVIRADLRENPSFLELLSRTKQTVLESFSHQNLPFETIVEELDPKRDTSRHPLFQVHFVVQHIDVDWEMFSGIKTSPYEFEFGTAKFDIMFFVFEANDSLSVRVEYNTDLFDHNTIEQMISQYEMLLSGVLNSPDSPVDQIPLLTQDDTQQLIDWNKTTKEYRRDITLMTLFEEQVKRTPDAPALSFNEVTLSYKELNERANQLAAGLIDRRIVSESLVGVFMERSIEMVVALYGIQKAGAAYVPIDPEYPTQRIQHMLEDATINLLLTQKKIRHQIPQGNAEIISLDAEWSEFSTLSTKNPNIKSNENDAAYVIFTSGSTGRPKGVINEQKGICNRLLWMQDQYGLTSEDRILQKTPFSFDVSVWEFFWPLQSGAELVLANPGDHKDSTKLAALIQDRKITTLHFVPSMLQAFIQEPDAENCRSLKRVICSGEALPLELQKRFHQKFSSELHNLYGPTEAAIDVTHWPCSPDDSGATVPIGRPIANTSIYIVDKHGVPVPRGVAGELWIGGIQVARGYLNQPELTAEKFMQDPFEKNKKARVYRTGDLARFTQGGVIEFLGRLDFQVKLRGFRIELGEIEAALNIHPAIEQSTILLREDIKNDQRLIAYVVAEEEKIHSENLKEWQVEQVDEWKTLWQEEYEQNSTASDIAFDIQSWKSSYTGELIDENQMRHWLDQTTSRIKKLQPKRVIEIGSGTGMIVASIAPDCDSYLATDFSQASINRLKSLIDKNPNLKKVELKQCSAEGISSFEKNTFDTVILNSVAQYFPHINYLEDFLHSAIDKVEDGGHIFLGDLRNLALLEHYHTSIALNQADENSDFLDLAKQIQDQSSQEEELLIHPSFFVALQTKIPRLNGIRFELKRGDYRNELSCFRYDVSLFIGKPLMKTQPEICDWFSSDLDLSSLKIKLKEIEKHGLLVQEIPDARISKESLLIEKISSVESDVTLKSIHLNSPKDGVEPEALYQLADSLNLDLQLSVGRAGFMNALFCQSEECRFDGIVLHPCQSNKSNKFSNNPLHGRLQRRLIPDLREHLMGNLPDYMIPSSFVVMDALPLTSNGKIDRDSLPAPDQKRNEEVIYVAPRNEIEEELVQIWSEILGLSRIGINDNFFSLGGHSLLATQLISRIRDRFKSELPLLMLFNHPTIAGLSDQLTQKNINKEKNVIAQINRDKAVPLSFSQQRLWFLQQLEGPSSTYNIALALNLKGHLNLEAMQLAINDLVSRHESLRTSIISEKGNPSQIIQPVTPLKLDLDDLNNDNPETLRQKLKELVQIPFELEEKKLIRFHILKRSEKEFALMLVMHHIVSDGWSLGILMRELSTLYENHCNNQNIQLPVLPIQFADYAVWQREWLSGDELDRQLDYWKVHLQDAPALLQIPTDRPRAALQTFSGADVNLPLSAKISNNLRELAKQENVTLFMLLFSAFNVLLNRYTGADDLVVGSPIAGRTRTETEGLIGFFVNTLALRTNIADNPTFNELLQRVRKSTLDAYDHQELPFEKLVEELKPERNTSYSPVFQVVFALQEFPSDGINFFQTETSPLDFDTGSSKFDLILFVLDTPEKLSVSVEYNTDLFNENTIERLMNHYASLLSGIIEMPRAEISALPLMSRSERSEQLEIFENKKSDFNQIESIHQLFEKQVISNPDNIALKFEEQELSYAELNTQSNRIAHYLIQNGVSADTIVGLCAERSLDLVVGILGILKAGGAYLPLDPYYPKDRINYMLEDSQTSIVLGQQDTVDILESKKINAITFDEIYKELNLPENNPEAFINENNLAYVIYTSGSTGKPKGALIEHSNVTRLLAGTNDWFGFSKQDVWTLFHSYAFDFTVWELWGSLIYGGKLIIVPYLTSRSPDKFLRLLIDEQVTVLNQTPSAFKELLRVESKDDAKELNLRYIIFGGEALDPQSLLPWIARHGDEATQLINMYGITETTVHVTYRRLYEADCQKTTSNIGKPIPDLTAYLLDENLEPVPTGLPGELYISGAGLARGYLNRPELTKERFFLHSFDGIKSHRLYKTGDIARSLPNGDLDYLGRSDSQVKVRGFRIELGEIEAEIINNANVDQAIVISREDEPGNQRLVAYIIGEVNTSELREELRDKLPEYMIPAAFVPIDQLPLTVNGKMDRNALPAPDWQSLSTAEYIVPRNPIEVMLAEAWQELLGIEKIGIEDDFFHLGGHSLLATRLVSRINETLDVNISLQTLFEKTVLKDLAKVLQANQGQLHQEPISKANRNESIPLSFAQQRLWFLDQLEPENPAYHLYLPLSLKGSLDINALQLALNDLICRHESLRTHFAATNSEPIQIITNKNELPLEHVDIKNSSEEELIQELVSRERFPFNLNTGPLIRASLFYRGHNDHVLLLVIHHIISDGWSLNLLENELAEAYGARKSRQKPKWDEMPIQYADFAIWQRQFLTGPELEKQMNYWRNQLTGAPPVIELPLDRPRPNTQSSKGGITDFHIDKTLTRDLKILGQHNRTTLFMTMLTGLKALFSRLSGEVDLVIGAPIAGRNRFEIEALNGFFVNALVLRSDLSGNPSFNEALSRVRKTTLDAYSNQDIPFELLVSELQPDRDTAISPLFQVAFSVETAAPEPVKFDGLKSEYAPGDAGTTSHDMVFLLWDIDGEIRGSVRYNIDLFNSDTIDNLLDQYKRILSAAASDSKQLIGDLELINNDELQKMVYGWNQTQQDFPSDTTIHWLFEQKAQQSPKNIAVEYGKSRLSYAELESKANQLAHYLIGMNVKRDDRIALCLDRSPNMIIGILGIMKAGAAYVPMDPSYPVDRLAYIIRDCGAKILLCDSSSNTSFSPKRLKQLNLDQDWKKISSQSTESANAACGPENLAYVIYTSGSTGKPKGVMVEHRGVCNLAFAQIKVFQVKPSSRVLQYASFSFDASFSEIAMSLLSGATLVLEDRDNLLPGDPLLKTLKKKAITTVTLTPSVLINSPVIELPKLETIVTAGEACPQSIAETWGKKFRLINAYGPTETSVCATAGVCDPESGSPSIGKPIANAQVYLLDEELRPVPLGAIGEICVGGVGVTRGYINQPELTAEKFITNQFSSEKIARLYRTGDLGRFRNDGQIDFIGRIDNQVKVRGFRIEPGEIETALITNSNVKESIVVTQSQSNNNQQLIAYVVPEQKDRELELWPSVAEFYVYDEALYYAMTHDERRNAAYVEAIRKSVPGKIVLDIGTGQDAILARLCIAEGAKKVYAIELLEESYQKARATIHKHKLEEKIILIHGNSFEVELPEKVDVCVSELVGAIGGSEGVAKIINDAHRYLKPEGKMIPEISETLIAAVNLPENFLKEPGFSRATANYTEKIFNQVGYPFDLRLCVKGLDYDDIISDTSTFEMLDHRNQVSLEETSPLILTINENKRIDGFLVWLTLTTAEDCTLIDSLSHEHCWLPVYLPVFDPGVDVKAGDRIEAEILRTLCDNELNPDYRIRGKLIRVDSSDISFDYDCFHFKNQYRSTPFYSRLFKNNKELPIVQSTANGISATLLRTHLQEQLPEHMIPAYFVSIDKFPLTPNGKIDRKALPKVSKNRLQSNDAYVAPTSSNEQLLTGIWKDLLGADRIGIDDNFFELGGDSILSIQIIARAASKGIKFTPKQLFKHQTIRKLAATVENQTNAVIKAEQGLVSGNVALTPIVRWFLDSKFANPHQFNQSLLYESDEDLELDILNESFSLLIKHHDALRLSIESYAIGSKQTILASPDHKLIDEHNLSKLTKTQQSEKMEYLANEAQSILDPKKGKMLKALLFKLGENDPDKLLIVIHHLSVDWVSWPILLEDIENFYSALKNGNKPKLPAKTSSVQQWVEKIHEYASSEELLQEISYWQQQPWDSSLAIPIDKKSGKNTESTIDQITVNLDKKLTNSLLTTAPQKYHAQANDIILTAIALAITEWSKSNVALISMEGHGREDIFDEINITRTVGWFTSLYPVLLQPDESRQPGESIKAIKEQLRNIPNHGIGFGVLRYLNNSVEVQQIMEKIPSPIIGFNYLGQTDNQFSQDRLFRSAIGPVGNEHSPEAERTHLLDITASVSNDQFYLSIDYSNEKHNQETINQFAAKTLENLRSLLDHCLSVSEREFTPSDFPLASLSQIELSQFTKRFNSIEDIYSLTPLQEGMLFHSEFEDESDAYLTQFATDLVGPMDAAIFEESWKYLIKKYDVLRSSLHWQGLEKPVQIVHKEIEFALKQDDWSDISKAEIKKHFSQLMQLERDKGFILDQPQLNRVNLIKSGPEHFKMLWTFHHALLDGWSIPLVLNDLLEIYNNLSLKNQVSDIPTNKFGDFIEWLDEQDPFEAQNFWRKNLSGFNTPTPLPGVDQSIFLNPESAKYKERHQTLPEEVGDIVKKVAQKERLTINTFIQAAWALVLARYSGNQDVLYGSTTSGRPASLSGVEGMIGQFLNTLPVRVNIDDELPIIEWLQILQENQLSIRAYEYSSLIDIQSWSEIPRGQQMFESLLAYENYPQMPSVSSDESGIRKNQKIQIKTESTEVIERTNYPLTFTALMTDRIGVRMIYDTRAYNDKLIDQLLYHFTNVLKFISANLQTKLGEISLIDSAEQENIRKKWNDTSVPYPTDVTLQSLFELQVARSPDSIAIDFEGIELSYGELNSKVNKIAHLLRDKGIGPEKTVGICMNRSIEMVLAIYGIIKAGGAYVPLDPDYPKNRLKNMCQDAKVSLILNQHSTRSNINNIGTPSLTIDMECSLAEGFTNSNPTVLVKPNNAAYVIFTSGSTGRPKGVLNEHKGICNRLLWMQAEYKLNDQDCVLQKTPYSFDVSVWEFFWPLQAGAKLLLAKPEGHKDPDYLAELIQEKNVTTLHFVPSMLDAFLQSPGIENCRSIVRTFCSGEALSKELQAAFFEKFDVELHNLYGPTEAAVDVSYWACDKYKSDEAVPIGYPVANTQLYIVDKNGGIVPPGVPGEIWIAGDQVARGYVNSPELNENKFIKNPFSRESEARIYRTGDLGRYRNDGAIEFLGRIDSQIKLRGYRIELGEIESELKALKTIEQVAVTLREDKPGQPRLVAYVVGAETPETMREWLALNLPDYMIPSVFVSLKKLPLTQSGKLDQNALPKPDLNEAIVSEYVAPTSTLEVMLADIWQEILGVEKIGINDNFFQLGGHSIMAMKLTSKIMSKLQKRISVSVIFSSPTIAELASKIDALAQKKSESEISPNAIKRSSRRGKKRT